MIYRNVLAALATAWLAPVGPAFAQDSLTDHRTALFDLMESNTVTVSFADDSSLLSDANKGALTALVLGQHGGRSLKVAVAAWSDKAFPEAKAKLKATDVELARERATAVVSHLRSQSQFRDIEVVNMAKRENAFARFFATKASKVKAAFDGQAMQQPWVRHEAEIFRIHGGPGKTVVIAYDEAESLAH